MFKTRFDHTPAKGVKFPIPSMVQQCDKDSTDINTIIKRYGTDCVCAACAANPRQPITEDVAQLSGEDFNSMMQKMASINSQFEELPADVRKKFAHNPANMLEFMQNPANQEEAVKLGLIERRIISLPSDVSPVPSVPSVEPVVNQGIVQGNQEPTQVNTGNLTD